MLIAALLLAVQDPHYPLAEGHAWTYLGSDGKEYVRKVAAFDPATKQYRIEDPLMKEGFSIDGDGLKHRGKTLWIQLPPKKGAAWEDAKEKVSGAVEGEEEIEVPAGKFKTFRVKVTTPAFALTLWLAKDVGEAKREIRLGDQTMTLSLKAFRPGGK
ncbi:MAG TPA: hypothetical protein VF950_27930 [Planctomycetota bacterium]